jgi:hypothetical protein
MQMSKVGLGKHVGTWQDKCTHPYWSGHDSWGVSRPNGLIRVRPGGRDRSHDSQQSREYVRLGRKKKYEQLGLNPTFTISGWLKTKSQPIGKETLPENMHARWNTQKRQNTDTCI